jgi:MtN3 and saliva related transmembrane protein
VYGRNMPFVWPIEIIGIAGATLTTLCWLPQMLKVIREKETRALSLPTTVAFTFGVALWLFYGLAIEDWPLIGSNAATLALMLPILAMKLRHG